MKLQCPYCSQRMIADGELEVGTSVECPQCVKTFEVSAGNVVNEKSEREFAARPAQPQPLPQGKPREMRVVQSVLTGLLMVAAIVIALIGVAQFNNPAAKSAVHQIYFALTTIAFLLGAIFMMLFALLIKR